MARKPAAQAGQTPAPQPAAQPQSGPTPQISGAVLLYSRPEPLNAEAHSGLYMKRSERPYHFAATAHALPLQVMEFQPAALCFPVIFGGEDRLPLAITSIRQNENLFIKEDGAFAVDAYVPAFLRRYPFVLASNEQQEQLVVCIDRAASALTTSPEGGTPLFVDGKPSEYTEQAIQFCRDYETERRRTEDFVKRLRDLDLLETRQVTVTPRNPDGTAAPPVQMADYFAVSEAKLQALPDATLLELNATGALRQIHAHLLSLMNWDRLIAKTLERMPQAANA